MRPALIPDAIFFDVDGVLIDSLAVKGEAFADVFDDVPGSRQAVIDFHRDHGGVTRSEKITRLFELLFNRAPGPREIQERVDRFGEVVLQQVIQAPEIPGATEALHRWSSRCPLYAVSATPHDELVTVLSARNLMRFFSGVRGWPPTKSQAVLQMVADHDFVPQRTMLIGDSGEDLSAARAACVQFIHLQRPRTPSIDGRHPTLTELADLDAAIELLLSSTSV